MSAATTAPTFRDALRVWAKIGLIGFGGPAGQIALMHRILVDEKRWIGEQRFLHALNYCMLLPGPEAQQLAIYVGWLLHRSLGGLAAGLLFVLPGAVVMLALSLLYVGLGELPIVDAVFYGVKPAVLAIVLHALARIGRRALSSRFLVGLAVVAFIAIFFLRAPFPAIVLAAAGIGAAVIRLRPAWLPFPGHGPADRASAVDAALDAGGLDHARPSLRRALKLLAVWLPLWLGPVLLLHLWLGGDSVFSQVGAFFSKMAVVTFGGAYAVLAYVAQDAVSGHGWLSAGEMVDGLGMAETTPGPLILVLQFVGFVAAFRNPGALDPYVAGGLASLLTLWVTFTPCFLWIFLGAPYIERLRANRALGGALAGITAAVVGVVLNLALWFALHVVFAELQDVSAAGIHVMLPVWATLDGTALLLAAACVLAMFRFKLGMLTTLAAAVVGGGALRLFLH